MKIKIFTSSNAKDIESAVNAFISKKEVITFQQTYNSNSSNLNSFDSNHPRYIITILYNDK